MTGEERRGSNGMIEELERTLISEVVSVVTASKYQELTTEQIMRVLFSVLGP